MWPVLASASGTASAKQSPVLTVVALVVLFFAFAGFTSFLRRSARFLRQLAKSNAEAKASARAGAAADAGAVAGVDVGGIHIHGERSASGVEYYDGRRVVLEYDRSRDEYVLGAGGHEIGAIGTGSVGGRQDHRSRPGRAVLGGRGPDRVTALEVDDGDLPDMWERADLGGGETDVC